jgi:histidyl-tRNA synthetase
VIIGSKEIEQKYCLVKDLSTGLQEVVLFDRLFTYFNK